MQRLIMMMKQAICQRKAKVRSTPRNSHTLLLDKLQQPNDNSDTESIFFMNSTKDKNSMTKKGQPKRQQKSTKTLKKNQKKA